jgi:hypothetical protein
MAYAKVFEDIRINSLPNNRVCGGEGAGFHQQAELLYSDDIPSHEVKTSITS